MEGKILAAVFTTLAVVFVAVGGGEVETDVDDALPEEDSFITDLIPSISIIDQIFEPPEADTQAEIELKLLEPQIIDVDSSKLDVGGLNSLEGSTEISSQNDIGLRNFRGSIEMNNMTRVTGSATGFYSDEMSTNTSLNIDQELETSLVEASDVDTTNYRFAVESINLSSNETSSELNKSDTEVDITSFKGDLDIVPDDNVLLLDGKVAEVTAGQTSFGG